MRISRDEARDLWQAPDEELIRRAKGFAIWVVE